MDKEAKLQRKQHQLEIKTNLEFTRLSDIFKFRLIFYKKQLCIQKRIQTTEINFLYFTKKKVQNMNQAAINQLHCNF